MADGICVKSAHLCRNLTAASYFSAEKLYERFGLENGADLLAPYFPDVTCRYYEDSIELDRAEPLIEYILSCHGNQNQLLLDRYHEFRTFVERKVAERFSHHQRCRALSGPVV